MPWRQMSWQRMQACSRPLLLGSLSTCLCSWAASHQQQDPLLANRYATSMFRLSEVSCCACACARIILHKECPLRARGSFAYRLHSVSSAAFNVCKGGY